MIGVSPALRRVRCRSVHRTCPAHIPVPGPAMHDTTVSRIPGFVKLIVSANRCAASTSAAFTRSLPLRHPRRDAERLVRRSPRLRRRNAWLHVARSVASLAKGFVLVSALWSRRGALPAQGSAQ
jgi:hypothetical protein